MLSDKLARGEVVDSVNEDAPARRGPVEMSAGIILHPLFGRYDHDGR